MGWLSGIIGGGLGAMIAGPFGAVIGAALGAGMGHSQSLPQGQPGGFNQSQQRQAIFFTAAFSMVGKLAKADGRVCPDEIAAIEKYRKKLWDWTIRPAPTRSMCLPRPRTAATHSPTTPVSSATCSGRISSCVTS